MNMYMYIYIYIYLYMYVYYHMISCVYDTLYVVLAMRC